MTQQNSINKSTNMAASGRAVNFPQYRASSMCGSHLIYASTESEFYERIVQDMVRDNVRPHYPVFEEA